MPEVHESDVTVPEIFSPPTSPCPGPGPGDRSRSRPENTRRTQIVRFWVRWAATRHIAPLPTARVPFRCAGALTSGSQRVLPEAALTLRVDGLAAEILAERRFIEVCMLEIYFDRWIERSGTSLHPTRPYTRALARQSTYFHSIVFYYGALQKIAVINQR